MPKSKCMSCLGENIKKILRDNIRDPHIEQVLSQIPNCEDPLGIEMCLSKKRTPSAYREFISKCLKEKHIKGFGEAPAAMKKCAAEWREKRK